jgi:CubicO group peptidase (beta-lactamase class C family)
MRRSLLFIVALAACRTTQSSPVESRLATLDTAVPALMQSAQVPGVSVAVIDGENVRARTYGLANAKTGERATDKTVFEAASLGKPVFAYAVMKLVEQGKLDLDKPLSDYVVEPFASDPRVNKITARIVLSHRTGFQNWRRDQPLQIAFEPGTRFSYSGEGFVYLQRAVEAITHEPFDAFMRRTVFEPLGMSDTSYVWQPAYETRKAFAHDETGNVAGRDVMHTPFAASSLHTTAADYGRFISAILERRGITDKSVRAMLRPEIAVPESCTMCATISDPGPASRTISWGLGWSLFSSNGHHDFWHWGDNGAFKAYVIADDAHKSGVVMFMNGSGGLAIAGDIAAIALGHTPGAPALEQKPLDWVRYDRWDAPAKVALHDILISGSDAVGRLRATPQISEADVNSIGYSLLRAGHIADAVEVLRLNTQRHPDSWNAWDSFGDALSKADKRAEAIDAYAKSVELNPSNSKAAEILRRLRGSG